MKDRTPHLGGSIWIFPVVARYAERLTGRGGSLFALMLINGVVSSYFFGVKMKKNQIKVIKLDEDHRLYFFQRKILYRERKNGKLVTKYSGLTITDLLESSLINEDTKNKIREMLKN